MATKQSIELDPYLSVPPLSDGAVDYLMELLIIHGQEEFPGVLRREVIKHLAACLPPEERKRIVMGAAG